MTSPAAWGAAVRAELEQLATVFEGRFGLPLPAESNYVADARPFPSGGVGVPRALRPFFRDVGEVVLADVGNGYFIHTVSRVLTASAEGLPVTVEAGSTGPVTTFGSDGGGGLYCLARRDGSILHLPPGEVVAGVYLGGLGEVRVVGDLEEFLDRLLGAVREFAATGDVLVV